MNILPGVDSSKVILEVESLKKLLVETPSSFILSKIPLDRSSSMIGVNILDKVAQLSDIEYFEDHLSTEIVLSNETARV